MTDTKELATLLENLLKLQKSGSLGEIVGQAQRIYHDISDLSVLSGLSTPEVLSPHTSPDVPERVPSEVNLDNSNLATDVNEKEKYFDDFANDYIEFTYKNPTTYHLVQSVAELLKKSGFEYLPEAADWSKLFDPEKTGAYFTIRNGTSLAAFTIGSFWSPAKGVGAIGSHIDALTTKLKPVSNKSKVDGYELLGVSPYAGALSDVWWDRDLGIGGRVIYKNESSGKLSTTLVNSTPHPVAHIPTLAPHFGTPSNGPFNKETQAVPVVGFSDGNDEEKPTEDEQKSPLIGKHSLKLLRYISKLAGVPVSSLIDFDLDIFDVQKGTRGGLSNEFIYAPRVDDRICSYSALQALIRRHKDPESFVTDDSFNLVALYDNEEIGSLSRQGAKGGLLESTISRAIAALKISEPGTLQRLYANSVILSADVTHLLNPNFTEVYLEHHKPLPNTGIALALDSNGHMATDLLGKVVVEQLAKLNDDKVQYFQIRNDSRSGGTIGPSISSSTGARTIDLGIPQLSMHSIRATVGYKDVGLAVKFFQGFFKNWRKVVDGIEEF
ncbi:Vacuolar aminopeptidase 1 [Komagataella phaffii CBS 7435]|uniref:Vacuolar aminopeptidase n=3 Tax=Komagataella TaxID=460517 RepID=C4R5M0_KOMPG|nr:Vacuolar aminopeptidase [Komagataella phaffii GS115]ABJ98413.1 aminopeptidase 1 [Komagataella pastoris]AOA63918.1 GQ67_03908T0 [Komagataella phaffii]CAH2449347.1 Vacuolar aminopeptidase 1 [Komagataella phaffii CBS 7435]AOA68441.1 GQ68_03882T0 [Komagataella phaffii GS115]CAY70856.1 Vacuolar aminopeptidase [Komagataella phaffii GS115]